MDVHVPQGEGAVSGLVSSIFWNVRRIVYNGGSDVLIDDRLVCEKLTIFPYAECIVELCERLAFLWYSQVQDRSGVEEKCMCKNVSQHTRNMATATAVATLRGRRQF